MHTEFKPYPLATQHQFKINVVTLLDNVLSQMACFDDAELTFKSASNSYYDLIEQSPSSEDCSVLFTAEQIKAGIRLSELEEALAYIKSEDLGDSLLRFDCDQDETWVLSFYKDGDNTTVLSSIEVGHSS